MTVSRRSNLATLLIMTMALIISLLMVGYGDTISAEDEEGNIPEYAEKIFGEEILSIEIEADESEWQTMLDEAINEEFIMVDVIVNGTEFQNVGIRPKGNSSLSQVANDSTSDRYSYRIQFDEYVKGQTCFGLESLVVNNMLGDYTYMKEYVSYELMTEIGVEAPYFGFADISVNGENAGLYLAVEMYNESYEARVSNDTSGMLYNVKTMDGGNDREEAAIIDARPDAENMPMEWETSDPAIPDAGAEVNQPRDRNILAGGIGGRSSGGGTLEYVDDDYTSYSSIFDNVVGKGSEEDYQKVIEALKALSEGENLEKYFDIDQILRYLAAHTIVVNMDSYSTNMAQNYYIYELDGQITILPWDYNLAWGGMQAESASAVINFPIDTPVSGVELSSRPLIAKLFENEEYLDRYHGYLQELIDSYFSDGKFESKIMALDALIDQYVKNDSTAFVDYEGYKEAVAAFLTLGTLRGESIQGQLDGIIPSTSEGQVSNPELLIDSEGLDLNTLGSMGGGGKRDNTNMTPDRNLDPSLMQKAMEILQAAGGEMDDEIKAQLNELGLTDEQIERLNRTPSGEDGFPDREFGARNGNQEFQPQDQSAVQVESDRSDKLIYFGGLLSLLIGLTVFLNKWHRNY